MKKEIILASGSPRRRELLNQIGIDFTVITSDADEITTEKSPEKIVMQLSSLKAEAVAKLPVKKSTAAVQKSAAASFGDSDSYVIIGADTIVYADGQVLGKPRDERHAFDMIKCLSGGSHSVYTGVCGKEKTSFYEQTEVYVYDMTDEEILDYIKTKEPMDKAGAYGIQGRFAAFVSKIEGDYNSVVGLPVGRVYQELRKAGYIG